MIQIIQCLLRATQCVGTDIIICQCEVSMFSGLLRILLNNDFDLSPSPAYDHQADYIWDRGTTPAASSSSSHPHPATGSGQVTNLWVNYYVQWFPCNDINYFMLCHSHGHPGQYVPEFSTQPEVRPASYAQHHSYPSLPVHSWVLNDLRAVVDIYNFVARATLRRFRVILILLLLLRSEPVQTQRHFKLSGRPVWLVVSDPVMMN